MGDETSQRIKRVALSRFVEVGFGSTTVDELAANAGVGVASLYRRSPDKSALANELIVDYLDKFDTILAPVEVGTRKSHFQTLWSRLWSMSRSDQRDRATPRAEVRPRVEFPPPAERSQR